MQYAVTVIYPQWNHYQNLKKNPHLIRIACEHGYQAGVERRTSQSKRNFPPWVTKMCGPEASAAVKISAPDELFEYATAVLHDGLFMLEFRDAVHEGDGERLIRCWKHMLLYFRQAHHTNYAVEAFHLLALVGGVATPSAAHQLKWSRFINPSGKPGHNVPADLEMEHLNRFLKTYITGLGANVREKTIMDVAKALLGLKKVCDKFDASVELHQESRHHTRKSSQGDEKKIISELMKISPFLYTPGRALKSSKVLNPNIASQTDPDALISWLNTQKEKLNNIIQFNSCSNRNIISKCNSKNCKQWEQTLMKQLTRHY